MYMFADFNFPGSFFFSGETFGKQYLPFIMGLPKWFDHVLVKHVDGPPKCLLFLFAIQEIMRVSTYMIIYV